MPPPQIFSLDGHAYGLTVSGVQVVDSVPTDVAPIRWDWPSATNNGGISFTVEDEGGHSFPAGSVIRLTDNVNDELLFAGVLTNVRHTRGAGPTRYSDVTGTGWGLYLDAVAVLSWSWSQAGVSPAIAGMLSTWGSPIHYDGPTRTSDTHLASSVTNSTLRSAIDAILDSFLVLDTTLPGYYVDNDQRLHLWYDPADQSAIVGTATSVGDEGSVQPERMTYEQGSEQYRGVTAVYDYVNAFLGWVKNPTGAWDAGEPSTIFTSVSYGTTAYDQARHTLITLHSTVYNITFTTIEDGTWLPHQSITVDDSILTDSIAETFYVADVSGTIDDRNVVEKSVSIGARARSLVQTVASS